MKVLLSWLHELLPVQPSAQEVEKALTSMGIEVGSVTYLGEGFEKIVVAKINEVKKHPSADRLSLCAVTDGAQDYAIVCGATNMKAGDRVALAKPGAKIPNGMEIKKSKIRGETSEGMLCSETEMKLSEESEGILIFPADTPLGVNVGEVLGRNDWILELELTPNRGDCLSMIGVAREVAAALNVSPKVPSGGGDGPKDSTVKVVVHDVAGAPRFTIRHLEEIKVGPSPKWLASRLTACGVRSINNIVDVTNYILLGWGQPQHAFDKDKVKGAIQCRRAKEGEKVICLDDIERTLTAQDLVIADDSGAIGIAGVMGGASTAVSESTKSIYLETAFFDPKSIRLTARRLDLHTEASHRFERTVDMANVWAASNRAVEILSEVAGAKPLGGVDQRVAHPAPKKVSLRMKTIERILGAEVKKAGEYLARLGFSVEKREDTFLVDIPPRRPDLEREIDLVEEVARIHGFNEFPSILPPLHAEPKRNLGYERIHLTRDLWSSMGYQEARSYSFASENDLNWEGFNTTTRIRISNPIAEGMEWMRTSILPGLIRSWKVNQARQKRRVSLFEIGTIFGEAVGTTPVGEGVRLSVILAAEKTPKTWFGTDRKADFFDLKGSVELYFERLGLGSVQFEPNAEVSHLHPGQSAKVMFRRKCVGTIGALHPRVAREHALTDCVVAEIDLCAILGSEIGASRFKQLSPFPIVERDMAFLVDKKTSVEALVAEVKKLKDPLLLSVHLFDLFEGKGMEKNEKSLAFTFTYGLSDRTLLETEVEESMKRISKHLDAQCNAKLRGEI
jgi:phenylalanyl-tRNA synthetase beta chain